jgi:hypothetical protein
MADNGPGAGVYLRARRIIGLKQPQIETVEIVSVLVNSGGTIVWSCLRDQVIHRASGKWPAAQK